MSIYREEIIDHYKHPRNYGSLPHPTIVVHEDNITCGDAIDLSLAVKGKNVTHIAFTGSGCALSIAGGSLLTELAKGKNLTDLAAIDDSDMIATVGGTITEGRKQCLLLGLKALKKALVEIHTSLHATQDDAEEQITRTMNLGEIAARWPAARSVLLDYGLHCVGCFASSFDTLEDGARVHGMSDAEIEEMLHEINQSIAKSGNKNQESRKSKT